MESGIYVGTSGWLYDHWADAFYPQDLKKGEWLSFYSKQFCTVELNNSFYQLPKKNNIEQWLKETPEHFLFSCKVSRYITHMKKLLDAEESMRRFLNSLKHFGGQLGPILFQFPPKWHVNTERFQHFLETLPKEHLYVFEFRDQSWFCERVYEILNQHNAVLCFYDFKGFQSPEVITSESIYIRLHGPEKTPYKGSYSETQLKHYAEKISHWEKEGKTVFCYFDNDEEGCAPHDAKKLLYIVEQSL